MKRTIRVILVTFLILFLGLSQLTPSWESLLYRMDDQSERQYSFEERFAETVSDLKAQWMNLSGEDPEAEVQIPETEIPLSGAAERETETASVENAVANLADSVTVRSDFLTENDFLSMDYGSFWLESWSYINYGLKSVYHLNYYDISPEQLSVMKSQVDAEIQDIIASVPRDATTWEAMKVVHDELCRRVSYDRSKSRTHCHDCYGALVEHSAVCTGYASAYCLILERLGIPCELVSSETHCWNVVRIPSRECFVDVTWDDTDRKDNQGAEYIRYDYFFLSKEEMNQVEEHNLVDIPSDGLPSGNMSYNYFTVYDYRIPSYDTNRIVKTLRRQIRAKKNTLSIRFERAEDYQRALQWFEHDSHELFKLLHAAGLRTRGSCVSWLNNDDLLTINILLRYPG